MTSISVSVSHAGFSRMWSGTPTLPMSCSGGEEQELEVRVGQLLAVVAGAAQLLGDGANFRDLRRKVCLERAQA